jgi:MFS transporter, DHA3 family, macrolide efflux protein
MRNNKNIWILMTGEFIAGLGMWIGIIGNLEFLQQLVPSDFMKSLILFTGLFVGVLFGPFAGKVIDQYSKKKVMAYSGIIRIISVFAMFIAISQEDVFWMTFYMLGIGISAAFYFPALQATIPMIVKDEKLLFINGIHMNVGTIARILGTALGGLLVVYFSLFYIYLFTLISYIIIFLCTLALRIEGEEKSAEPIKQSNKTGFKEMWPIILNMPVVVTGLLLMLVPVSFIGSFNLMVLKISEIQGDAAIKGLLYTTEGISLMISTLIIRRISKGKNIVLILITSALAIALAHLSLYFADIKILSILSFALFGFAAGSFYPLSATLFQKQIPKGLHGRFFSFRNMMDRVLFQIILLSTGLFLDTIGFKYMVLFFGGFSLLLVFVLGLRQWRKPVSYIQEVAEKRAN